jgi:hypothetical protein
MNMSELETKLEWESAAHKKFTTVIEKIPLFHREIAYKVVYKKAEMNAQERGSRLVEEADIVQAFFSEVPKAFYSLMIRLLNEVGFDYSKYKK